MSEAKTPPAPAPVAPSGGGGGIKALMPLILTLVLMPVLAYVMTAFVLVPKLQKATVQARVEGGGHGEEESGGHGEEAAADAHGKTDAHGKSEAKEADAHGKKADAHGKSEGGGHGAKGGGKPSVQFGKVLVNVAGSLGSRYLLTNFTLIGSSSDLKDKVENAKDQLMDQAIATLRTKTIQDLEKPGASNLIRTELISAFNGVLGGGAVKEIYFTEFAIQ